MIRAKVLVAIQRERALLAHLRITGTASSYWRIAELGGRPGAAELAFRPRSAAANDHGHAIQVNLVTVHLSPALPRVRSLTRIGELPRVKQNCMPGLCRRWEPSAIHSMRIAERHRTQ